VVLIAVSLLISDWRSGDRSIDEVVIDDTLTS